ncbi:MAG: hypothetical protein MUC77_03650 [Chromatiaceae bacterium]|nr:hypothetical protein [Chromatiaceae bacterium]
MRKHVEGWIAYHLRTCGAPHLYPRDNRAGRSKTLRVELSVTAPARILGLAETIRG